MIINELSTNLTSFEIYILLKNNKYCFLLDSGMGKDKLGKYSIIVKEPFLTFKSKNNKIEISDHEGTESYPGNPFIALNNIYKKYKLDYKTDLPFIGGMVGYFAYDLCHHVEKLPRRAVDDANIADCFLGVYDGAIVIDHQNDKVFVTDAEINRGGRERVNELINMISSITEKPKLEEIYTGEKDPKFSSNFEKEKYLNSITSIKEYIRSGDIYQTNMTQRFVTKFTGEPVALYERLRGINPAPFATYMDFKDYQIVSSSPERFIQIKDGIIETRPIKGTRPRGKNEEEDNMYRNELINSQKDRSELLMIVDLERNDLSKIAKVGTVKVPELIILEEYPSVFHLVSTVTAEIKDGLTPIDCIRATFPGGSITGAPKIRAMEVIDELEPTQRNIYTGSIGYIGFNGDTDLNIAIRTIVCKDEKAYFQAGGGIVWDSVEEDEFDETLHKARALMNALSN